MSKSTFQPQQHLGYIEGQVRTSLTGDPKIQPGCVIQFEYTKSKTDPKPLVLVVNVNYQGELHGINMNYLTRIQAKVISERLGMYKMYSNKNALIEAYDRNYPLVRLQMREDKGFYNGTLKPMLKNLVKVPSIVYRTYKVGGISSVQLIDYDWGGIDRGFRAKIVEWEREDLLSAQKDAQMGEGLTQAEADKE